MSPQTILLVFLGGGLGSVFRYFTSFYMLKLWKTNSFPLGTFLINILGCLLIGMFSSYFSKNNMELRYFFIVGFCGGFTTFSTFAWENYILFQNGQYFILIFYILASVLLGLAAVFAGSQIIN